jgi:prolyl-tRNA editing enzyme YbaK/EbsC (Cys-tRNA(Pro) deacylase)
MPPLTRSAQIVQDALAAQGFEHRVIESEHPTRTAKEAAQAVGCRVGQIAKSLVFRGAASGRTVLVIASGANRVDEAKLAREIGEDIEKPDADFVRERTGFAIGGIPPVGHREPLEALVDEDLMKHAEIWAAAGNPNALFRLAPAELLAMTRGRVVAIRA